MFEDLERRTGLGTGFRRTGSLLLATTAGRWDEVKRGASMARLCDVDVRLLDRQQVGEMWPLVDATEVIGAAYLPGDGVANPTDVTQALATAARMGGTRIFEHTKVTAIHERDGRVSGVSTEHGDIACESIVNCTGMWARELGAMNGVDDTEPRRGALLPHHRPDP